MTAIEAEAKKPRQEFWIAVVGPLTSLAVGLVDARRCGSSCPTGCCGWSSGGSPRANLLIGALNLVPGLPLDGGRVLKAAVWGAPAARTAAPSSPAGAAGSPRSQCCSGRWRRSRSSTSTPDAVRLRAGLRHRRVPLERRHRRAAARQDPAPAAGSSWPATSPAAPSPSPSDLPLAEAVRRAREAQAGAIVTVTGSGSPVGVVNEAALLATPEDRRPWLAGLDRRPRRRRRSAAAGRASPARSWSGRSRRTPATEYLLVEEDGSVYGVLATADVDRAFRSVPD